MALKVIHDTLDEIPEQYRDLYTEKDGKWVLTGVTGVKLQSDVDALQTALGKERADHKKTKDALKPWTELGVPLEELQEKLDKMPELEAAAKGKLNDEQINEIVDKRVAAKLKPIEKERDTAKARVVEVETENTTLKGEKTTRTVHDAVREAATKANLLPSAVEDALMVAERIFEVGEDGKTVVAKDNVGVIPGIAPDVWLSDMQEKRPHWWAPSSGGGATGGKGGGGGNDKNPWSAANWNLTAQGQYVAKHGVDKANQMAAQVGSKVGAIHPPKPAK